TVVRFARTNPDMTVIQAAWDRVKAIPTVLSKPDTSFGLLGGDPVEASLACIRLYDQVQATQPFHTVKYILVHPMPRAWWPDKPLGLGYTLPFDTGWIRARGGYVNVGPGIVGHAYHE